MARIVVIEDNEFTLATLRHVLELLGHAVTTATNGREGFETYLSVRPDVVITDIFMPERDGFEFIRDLKTHNPAAKVICISAGSSLSTTMGLGRGNILRYAEDFGADAAIAKPFTPQQLIEALNTVLPRLLPPENGAPAGKEPE